MTLSSGSCAKAANRFLMNVVFLQAGSTVIQNKVWSLLAAAWMRPKSAGGDASSASHKQTGLTACSTPSMQDRSGIAMHKRQCWTEAAVYADLCPGWCTHSMQTLTRPQRRCTALSPPLTALPAPQHMITLSAAFWGALSGWPHPMPDSPTTMIFMYRSTHCGLTRGTAEKAVRTSSTKAGSACMRNSKISEQQGRGQDLWMVQTGPPAASRQHA